MKISKLTKKIISMMLVVLCLSDNVLSANLYTYADEYSENMETSEMVSDNILPELSGEYDDYIVKPTNVETTLASTGKKGSLTWSIDSNGHLYIYGSGQPEFVPIKVQVDEKLRIKTLSGWPWQNYHDKVTSCKVRLNDFTDAAYMFSCLVNMESIDLSELDTSKIIDTTSMFAYCNNLKNIDLSKFNISNVESIGGMFMSCTSLEEIDISSFDTKNVVDMTGLFMGCKNLENIKFGDGFNTSKVYSMELMFSGCKKIKSIDTSKFDTSNVIYMYAMFNACENLEYLDLTSFDTSKVLNYLFMFYECDKLKTINISSFNILDEANYDYFFEGCDSLEMVICPKNVSNDITLPVAEKSDDEWYRAEGKKTTVIPNSNTSIVVTKNYYKAPASMSSVVVGDCSHGSIYPFSTTKEKKITYDSRAAMCFDIEPEKGYLIDDVIVDGKSVGEECKGSSYRYCFPVSEIKEHTINATFTKIVENEINYKIESIAGKNGTITPLGIIKVNPNESADFKVTASEGYKIKYIFVDNELEDVDEESTEYSFSIKNVDKDHEVRAYFEIKFEDTNPWHDGEKLITAICGEHGTISPAGETYVKEGETITYTITPDEGYDILEVMVDGNSKGAISTYKFNEVSKDHKIEAKFIKTYTINSVKGVNGTISPSGEHKVREGSNAYFTIVADKNYAIGNVYIDGEPIGPESTYIFRDVRENHTISANFITTLFTVTFDPNGGTVDVKNKNVSYNYPYGELPVAEKRGEVFAGWYTEKEGGELITSDTVFTDKADKVIYAHYEELSFAVKQKYDVSKYFKDTKGIKKYKVVRVNNGKATVSKKGMFTAKKEGKVEIIPLVKEGKKYVEVENASIFINITKPKFTEKKISMKAGEEIDINSKITGLPSATSNEYIYYTPNKKKTVIKMDVDTGKITAIQKGSTKASITVRNNQGYKVKYTVTIKVMP